MAASNFRGESASPRRIATKRRERSLSHKLSVKRRESSAKDMMETAGTVSAITEIYFSFYFLFFPLCSFAGHLRSTHFIRGRLQPHCARSFSCIADDCGVFTSGCVVTQYLSLDIQPFVWRNWSYWAAHWRRTRSGELLEKRLGGARTKLSDLLFSFLIGNSRLLPPFFFLSLSGCAHYYTHKNSLGPACPLFPTHKNVCSKGVKWSLPSVGCSSHYGDVE